MITFAYSDNSQAVAKSLAGFQDAMADQAPALGEIADDFREMVARQFASEGRAEGMPWAARHHPSVPSSLRRGSAKRGVVKARPGQALYRMVTGQAQGLPLLVRTGALRDSLTRKGAAGHVEELDRQTLSIGSRLSYALFHQLGTRRMAARPIVVLSDARGAKWTAIIRGAIETQSALLGAKELGGGK